MADSNLEIQVSATGTAKATADIKNFAKAVGGELPKKLDAVTNSSKQANNAVLNLGRVAQDSAFGFIGIANNLEPLAQSFRALRAESTSSKAALKAFFGSLAGAGGIGLLIGAVQLIDAAANGYGIFAGKTKAAKDEQAEFNKELRSAEVSASAVGVKLQTLIKIAGDSSLPLAQQQEALRLAGEEGQKYGLTINAASIANGTATKEVDKLTKALVAQAVATKLSDRVADLEIKRVDISREALAQLQKVKALQDEIDQEEGSSRRFTLSLKRNAAESKYNDLLEQGVEVARQKSTAQLDNANATKAALAVSAAQNAQEIATDKAKVASVAKLSTARATSDTAAARARARELADEKAIAKERFKQLENEAQAYTFQLRERQSDAIKLEQLKQQNQATAVQNSLLAAQKIINENAATNLQNQLNLQTEIDRKTTNIVASFGLLSPIIGQAFNALANGKSGIDSLKQGVKALIIELAKAAALAVVIALATGGLGAAAKGGGFAKIFGGLLGFKGRAAGGGISGPTIVGEKGPELFVPSDSGRIIPNGFLGMGGGGGRVEFRIQGGDLFGLLRKTQGNYQANFG